MERNRINYEDYYKDRPLTKKEKTKAAIGWAAASIGGASVLVYALVTSGGEGKEVYSNEEKYEPVREFKMPAWKFDEGLEFATQTPTPSPSPTATATFEITATPTPHPTQTENNLTRDPSKVLVSGSATYYGIDDGYGLHNKLGCTHEPFDPTDVTTAARSEDSPFVCGDRVKVCESDNNCIEVVIKDTCPGCDDWGKVIDLSHGASSALNYGDAATIWVTLEPVE